MFCFIKDIFIEEVCHLPAISNQCWGMINNPELMYKFATICKITSSNLRKKKSSSWVEEKSVPFSYLGKILTWGSICNSSSIRTPGNCCLLLLLFFFWKRWVKKARTLKCCYWEHSKKAFPVFCWNYPDIWPNHFWLNSYS